ncbi:type VI immunity family protein [Variovorax sp. LT1R20]|uniref:type VI immunity family protein n=1 Tax=Variovorax sp. LT1R20 TaxID=3443729 RepID=UPI003F472A63
MQLGHLYSSDEQKVRGITGAHWLNFLNDDWGERLGGLERLRDQLPADSSTVEPYNGGVSIHVGQYPEPGHMDDRLPPRYVWLNRVLKSIRVPRLGYHIGNTPGELALPEDAMPYFTRFDAASEALGLQLQSDEGDDPSAPKDLADWARANRTSV